MSRIGRMPITVPAGVTVTIEAGNVVTAKGPKGTLTEKLHPAMKIENEAGVLHVIRPNDEKESKALHGLTRSLLANMVEGVSNGFSKTLEINGVGYRAAKSGKTMTLSLGYSHPIIIEDGNGVTFEVPNPNTIIVSGVDKQAVGQMAAVVRSKRPPEPYLGKGIKYQGEYIRRKAGKTGK
ncbi:MAG: 50S ribosomal protein L6 [Eubacteriales bacterium]|mgnify:CR=1 FL=1|nr:50S ribosomal protein L6 [Eubacteriales bacterium]